MSKRAASKRFAWGTGWVPDPPDLSPGRDRARSALVRGAWIDAGKLQLP